MATPINEDVLKRAYFFIQGVYGPEYASAEDARRRIVTAPKWNKLIGGKPPLAERQRVARAIVSDPRYWGSRIVWLGETAIHLHCLMFPKEKNHE